MNVLLASPLSRGLFERAMIESGGGRNNILPLAQLRRAGPHGQRSAQQDAVAFARLMGIQGTGAAALAALRRLPAAKVVDGLNMASMFNSRVFDSYSGPILDGRLIPQSPEQAFKEGREAKVPVLVGANSDDLGFVAARTPAQLFLPFGKQAAAARAAFYPGRAGNFQAVAQQVGRVEDMIEPARFVARQFAAAGESAYEYRFSYVAASLRKRLPGAPHSSEIPYVFDTVRMSTWAHFGRGITAMDLETAREMNAYWLNFAETGNPNGPRLPHWPRITAHGNQLMNFTREGPRAETDPWKAQLDLVETIQP